MKFTAIFLIFLGAGICLVSVVRNWGKVKESNTILDGVDEMYFGGFFGMIFHAAKSATKSKIDKLLGCTGFILIAAGMIWELS